MARGSLLLSPLRVALLPVLLSASCTRQSGPNSVPEPLEVESKEALGYVAIPSLDKLLKEASALVNLFAPGKVTRDTLQAQLGSMLGDPKLANLEMEKPVVLLMFKAKEPNAPPSFAAILPAKQADPYVQALAGMGMQARYEKGFLLAAQTPQGLEAVGKAKSFYGRIVGARIEKTGRIYFNIAGLMETYGALLESQIETFLSMMPSTAGLTGAAAQPESLRTLLKLEVKGLLALLKQYQSAQVDLDLQGHILGIEHVVAAKPRSALGNCFIESSRRPSPSTGLLETGGFLTGALTCDARSLGVLFKQLFDEVLKEPEGAGMKEALAPLLAMGDWWGGTAAISVHPGRVVPFSVESDMNVVDEAKYLSAMEKGVEMFASPGISDLYRGMGLELSMRFEKATRNRAGVPVHRWKMSLEGVEGKGPPGVDVKMLKAFLGDTEFAFVKGRGLASNERSRLDALIDLAQSSPQRESALEAQKTFGDGRHGYFDYDLLRLLKSLVNVMPDGPEKQPLEAALGQVKTTEPMLFAVTFGDGRAQLQMRLPLRPFGQMMPRGN